METRSLEEIEQDYGGEPSGDLLGAVLRVPGDYWAGHPEQHVRVNAVVARLAPEDVDDTLRDDITAFRA